MALTLPEQPGTYALILRLAAPATFVYRRRVSEASAGRYVYIGSARGPGGVRGRLGRHIRGAGQPRWHVDALREVARVEGWAYTLAAEPLECGWVRALLGQPGVYAPWLGFGSSDCRQGCPAHLLAVPDDLDLEHVLRSGSPLFDRIGKIDRT